MSEIEKRPSITSYDEPKEFMKEMLHYRKSHEPGFTVARAAKGLRKVSPALISLILKGERRMTLDRAEELSKLMGLTASEKMYFKNWLSFIEEGTSEKAGKVDHSSPARKDAPVSLLSDWLRVYVKDLFQLREVQGCPDLIYRKLAHVAPPARIRRAYQFLTEHGYLRKTSDGRVVIDTKLSVTDPGVPHSKIRQFHKAALNIAKQAIDLHPPTERIAGTMTVPLTEESYQEMKDLIGEFSEKLMALAERQNQDGDQLYQVTFHLSPVGGKQE